MTVKVIDVTATTEGAKQKVYDERPHGEASIKAIVLHATGSGPKGEAGDQSWLTFWHPNPVSIHQLIRRDGTIVQIVKNVHRAWHAGLSSWLDLEDMNTWAIGIEICNNDVGEPYTPAQLETVAETVAYNCALYKIPDAYVATHKQVRGEFRRRHPGVTNEIKTDPFGFSMPAMWSRVRAIRANWPAGWPTLRP